MQMIERPLSIIYGMISCQLAVAAWFVADEKRAGQRQVQDKAPGRWTKLQEGKKRWPLGDLNTQPIDLESIALPITPRSHFSFRWFDKSAVFLLPIISLGVVTESSQNLYGEYFTTSWYRHSLLSVKQIRAYADTSRIPRSCHHGHDGHLVRGNMRLDFQLSAPYRPAPL